MLNHLPHDKGQKKGFSTTNNTTANLLRIWGVTFGVDPHCFINSDLSNLTNLIYDIYDYVTCWVLWFYHVLSPLYRCMGMSECKPVSHCTPVC